MGESEESDAMIEYTCDENWNPLLGVKYLKNGKIDYSFRYTYDKDGTLTKKERYSGDDELETVWNYLPDGREYERVVYQDGNVQYRYEFEQDEHGFTTKETKYDGEDELIDSYISEYDEEGCRTMISWYDDEGNLSRVIRYMPNLQHCETAEVTEYSENGEETVYGL